jgi:hypothetical protein
MDKKTKAAILMLGVYLLVFGVGFKSGTAYLRMQRKVQVERIVVPDYPQFYVVERHDHGSYSSVTFEKANKGDAIIEIFMNEKLRPLLKLRDIKIYKPTGEQVY